MNAKISTLDQEYEADDGHIAAKWPRHGSQIQIGFSDELWDLLDHSAL